eukprot:8331885-Prorocentrum_lima.AAC.1
MHQEQKWGPPHCFTYHNAIGAEGIANDGSKQDAARCCVISTDMPSYITPFCTTCAFAPQCDKCDNLTRSPP